MVQLVAGNSYSLRNLNHRSPGIRIGHNFMRKNEVMEGGVCYTSLLEDEKV